MKKAFTMIELVFVIMILGIISSIAVPKLAATREDAQIVKYKSDLVTLDKDLHNYYAANGDFSFDYGDYFNIFNATNVALRQDKTMPERFYFDVNKKPCVRVVINSSATAIVYFLMTPHDALCDKLLENDTVAKVLSGRTIWSDLNSKIETLSKSSTKEVIKDLDN